jgi:hypothetical protein
VRRCTQGCVCVVARLRVLVRVHVRACVCVGATIGRLGGWSDDAPLRSMRRRFTKGRRSRRRCRHCPWPFIPHPALHICAGTRRTAVPGLAGKRRQWLQETLNVKEWMTVLKEGRILDVRSHSHCCCTPTHNHPRTHRHTHAHTHTHTRTHTDTRTHRYVTYRSRWSRHSSGCASTTPAHRSVQPTAHLPPARTVIPRRHGRAAPGCAGGARHVGARGCAAWHGASTRGLSTVTWPVGRMCAQGW